MTQLFPKLGFLFKLIVLVDDILITIIVAT